MGYAILSGLFSLCKTFIFFLLRWYILLLRMPAMTDTKSYRDLEKFESAGYVSLGCHQEKRNSRTIKDAF